MITLDRKKRDKPKRDVEGALERRRQRWANKYNGDILQLDFRAISGVADEVRLQLVSLLNLSEEDFALEVYNLVEDVHPQRLETLGLEKHVLDNISSIYTFYRFRDSLLKGRRIRRNFALADERAISFINGLDDFHISKYVTNKSVRKRMLNFLSNEHLNGRTAKIDSFMKTFKRNLKDISRSSVQNIVDTSVSRIRNWGHIRQLSDNNMGVAEVSEIIDKVTCDICREMHGKTFRVAYADAKVQELSSLTPEEFQRTVYDDAPSDWKKDPAKYAKDHSVEQFIANDMVGPPWHGRCRGRLIIK